MKNKNLFSILALFFSLCLCFWLLRIYNNLGTVDDVMVTPRLTGSTQQPPSAEEPSPIKDSSAPENEEKEILETVQFIVQKAMAATGYASSMPPPKVVIKSTEDYGCRYRPENKVIYVEKKLYSLCLKFGKNAVNALAFFIIHEVVHHAKKHQADCYFVGEDKIEDISLKQEIEADDIGCCWAWLADYPQDHVQEYFEAFYEAYRRSPELEGYEHLIKRIIRARNAAERIKVNFHIYLAANYLTAISKNDYAQELFVLVEDIYKGPELVNNYAISLFSAGLNKDTKKYYPFLLPFELQFQGRIQKKAEEFNTYGDDESQALFREAINKLGKILPENIENFGLRVNYLMMCIAKKKLNTLADTVLLQQINELRATTPSTRLQKDFVLALYYAIHGEQSESKKIWERISKNQKNIYGKMAYYNLLVQNNPAAADSLQKSDFFATKSQPRNNLAEESVPKDQFKYDGNFEYCTYNNTVWYRFSPTNEPPFYIRRSFKAEPIPSNCRGIPFAGGTLYIVNPQKLIRVNQQGKVTEVIEFISSH